MTDEQIASHEKAGVRLHYPDIAHQGGAVLRTQLIVCDICGANITESLVTPGLWLEFSPAEVENLRRQFQKEGRRGNEH